VNTGDDWQKSQWSPPRLAQGTRVIRQVSCSRRRVGEVSEETLSLGVQPNVFAGTIWATPCEGSSALQAVRHQCCVFSCEFDLTIVVAGRTQGRNAAHLSLHEEFRGKETVLGAT
jgi:hypothetical protein